MALILVVDDDRNLCRVLKGHLEKAGFDVLLAHDVDSALPVIREKDLDLVITDLKMPGKSGMELLPLSKEQKPATPVIMITAYGNIGFAVEAIKKGAYDFVTKPFDEMQLLECDQEGAHRVAEESGTPVSLFRSRDSFRSRLYR